MTKRKLKRAVKEIRAGMRSSLQDAAEKVAQNIMDHKWAYGAAAAGGLAGLYLLFRR